MNFLDLRKSLALRLGLDTVAADGLVAMVDGNLLNHAAREIGTSLMIPRKTVTYTAAQLKAGITLPSDFVDVVRIMKSHHETLPIIDSDNYVAPTQNEQRHVLEAAAHGGYFVYDRRTPSLTWVREFDHEPPENVKLVYLASWTPMTADAHTPWLNQYTRWHEVIAARAAVTALLSLDPGEPETAARLKYNNTDYQNLYNQLSEEAEPAIFFSGPAITTLINRRESWR